MKRLGHKPITRRWRWIWHDRVTDLQVWKVRLLVELVGAHVAQVLTPLDVCVVHFEINSVIFVFVNVQLSIASEGHGIFGTIRF